MFSCACVKCGAYAGKIVPGSSSARTGGSAQGPANR